MTIWQEQDRAQPLASVEFESTIEGLLFLKHLTWCLALGDSDIMILITIINGCLSPLWHLIHSTSQVLSPLLQI